MVLLGGAVRLTGSGLSMVDWRPLEGAIPPLGPAAWQRAFENYRQFPEFKLVNPGMTPAEFRFIFWMEYAHRLLGRVTGLVFVLPFLFFLWRRMVPPGATGRLWALFFLGGAQGLLGWYMVKSGLADDPRVSHHRLAAHLMLAVVIYAWMLRMAADLWRPPAAGETMQTTGRIALGAVLLMMYTGALVAGADAGYGHNTWPKMDGRWLPPQLLAMHPWWLNFFENLVTIQFVHRWLAAAVLLAVGGFALRLIYAARPFTACVLLAAALVQIALGIATLTQGVPVALGVAHQAGAMGLLSVVVLALRRRRIPIADNAHRQPASGETP